jgi:hypothetical protein
MGVSLELLFKVSFSILAVFIYNLSFVLGDCSVQSVFSFLYIEVGFNIMFDAE